MRKSWEDNIMRIGINFHTFDNYISGVEYYTLGMIDSLLRLENQNEYVIFTNVPHFFAQYTSNQSSRVTIKKIDCIKTRTQRILWEHFQLPRQVRREKLNVLHCPCYICPVTIKEIPCVVTIHDTIAIDHPGWCKPSNAVYFNMVMKMSLRASAAIVAVSHAAAGDVARNYSLDKTKIIVAYPGIDPIFNAKKNRQRHIQIREKYHLPEQYILYVGNLEPKKNIEVVLSSFMSIKKRSFPYKLVLAGKRQWGVKSLIKKSLRENKNNDILFPGYILRADLPSVYQLAKVFIWPSLYEGFGFPPLEAMACGVPVISSSRGALKETLGDAACLINPTKPMEISHALRRMTAETDFRDKYIKKGFSQSRRFNWEKTALKLSAIYKDTVTNYA